MPDDYIVDNYGYKSQMVSVFYPSDVEELKNIVRGLNKTGCGFKVLGNLSNTFVVLKKSPLVIIRLKKGIFKNIGCRNGIIEAGAGISIAELMGYCIKHSLGGLEFLAGIPGTVGASVAGNAGAYGKEIAGLVLNVDCLDYQGNFKTFNRNEIEFDYRDSNLRDFIVIAVSFKVDRVPRAEIKDKMRNFIRQRFAVQDLQSLSCGCFFKNPREFKAGRIIDIMGLREKRRADVSVSDKHANFLISTGNTNPEDVLSLKDVIQRRIWLEKKVWLEPEVDIIW